MHVVYGATGLISQIFKSHMCHQLQQVCDNCNAPLGTTIPFRETLKIYVVDVTDRNVTLSRTVKIQGSVCVAMVMTNALQKNEINLIRKFAKIV
jgi:hypothetical protein